MDRPDSGEDALTGSADAEAQYRRLLDRSLAPVCIHDGRSLHYVNPAAVRTLGAESHGQIVGRPLSDFIHSASLAGVQERIARLRDDGDVSEPSEVTLLRTDGTTLAVSAVAAVRASRGGQVYEVIFRESQATNPVPGTAEPALGGTTEAVITTDRNGIVTGWNPAAHNLYGRSADEVLGLPIERAVGASLDPSCVARAGGRASTTHHRAGGTPLAVAVLAIRTSDGYVVVCDMTAAAKRDEQRWHAVLDLLHDGVVIMGSDGRFEFTNKAARRILGSPAEDLIGRHHSTSGIDLPLFDTKSRQIGTDQHPMRRIQKTGLSLGGDVIGVDRIDGRRVWITGHGCLIDPGDPENSSVLFSFTDITEHYAGRERLLHDATHDWLTGLPNRLYALDRAAQALAASDDRRLSAVLFIDLDRLKTVNDSHGHPIGDDVLRTAAQRMRSVTRQGDVVARIGGDEFVVLLMGPVVREELNALVARLEQALGEDIAVGSLTLRIGASIGVTTVDAADTRSLAEVLRDADIAMYRAKAERARNVAHLEHTAPSDAGEN